MNDQELDQILEAWTLALPSPSLRDRVRAQYRYKLPRRFPVRGLLIAAAVFLITVLAFSQTSRMFSAFAGIPFTVDMQRDIYANDGTLIRTLDTCYEFRGAPLTLSVSRPGHPLWTMGRHVVDTLVFITTQIAPSFIVPPETPPEKGDRLAFIKAGCVKPHDVVLGYENIAGSRTVKVLSAGTGSERRTNWYAPDLGCFPMGSTIEEVGMDGKIHMKSRVTVLAVHR
jgi:hypothetical protein